MSTPRLSRNRFRLCARAGAIVALSQFLRIAFGVKPLSDWKGAELVRQASPCILLHLRGTSKRLATLNERFAEVRRQFDLRAQRPKKKDDYVRDVPVAMLNDERLKYFGEVARQHLLYLAYTLSQKTIVADRKSEKTGGATESDWFPLHSKILQSRSKDYASHIDILLEYGYLERNEQYAIGYTCRTYRLGKACDLRYVRNPNYEEELAKWEKEKAAYDKKWEEENKRIRQSNPHFRALSSTIVIKRNATTKSKAFCRPRPQEYILGNSPEADNYAPFQFTNKSIIRSIEKAKKGSELAEVHEWQKFQLDASIEITKGYGFKERMKIVCVLPEMLVEERAYHQDLLDKARMSRQEEMSRRCACHQSRLEKASARAGALKASIEKATRMLERSFGGDESKTKRLAEAIISKEKKLLAARDKIKAYSGKLFDVTLKVAKKWDEKEYSIRSSLRHSEHCYRQLNSGNASYVIDPMGRAHTALSSLPNRCTKYVRILGEPMAQCDFKNSQMAIMAVPALRIAEGQHPIVGGDPEKAEEWLSNMFYRLMHTGKTRPIIGERRGWGRKEQLRQQFPTSSHMMATVREVAKIYVRTLKENIEDVREFANRASAGTSYEYMAKVCDKKNARAIAEGNTKEAALWEKRRTSHKDDYVFSSFAEMVGDKEHGGRSQFKGKASFSATFGHPDVCSSMCKAIKEDCRGYHEANDLVKRNLDYGLMAKLAQHIEASEMFALISFCACNSITISRHDSISAPAQHIETIIEPAMSKAFEGKLKVETTKPTQDLPKVAENVETKSSGQTASFSLSAHANAPTAAHIVRRDKHNNQSGHHLAHMPMGSHLCYPFLMALNDRYQTAIHKRNRSGHYETVKAVIDPAHQPEGRLKTLHVAHYWLRP